MKEYVLNCLYCGWRGDWGAEEFVDSEPICRKCKDANHLRVSKKSLAGTNPFGYPNANDGNEAGDEQE